jgi:hypothetical protein
MQEKQFVFWDDKFRVELPSRRFMWFKLEEDPRLDEEEIYFGPESIRIEWSEQ